jgi:hypothetical protein
MSQPATPAGATEPAPSELSLADELTLLAVEHSDPVICECGASWDIGRALAVVSRYQTP